MRGDSARHRHRRPGRERHRPDHRDPGSRPRRHPGPQLTDTQGQPLTPFAPPTLTCSNDELSLGDATLTDTGAGAYRAELTIPTDGDWTAQVSVRTSEFDNPVASVPFTIQ